MGAIALLRKAGSSLRVQPGGSTAATALGRKSFLPMRKSVSSTICPRAGSNPSGLRPGSAARVACAGSGEGSSSGSAGSPAPVSASSSGCS